MLALVQEHCKEAYLALNEIQRAWMRIDDTAAMLEATYAYLYDLYPPRFPAILRDLLSEEELAAIEDPRSGVGARRAVPVRAHSANRRCTS